MRNKKQMVLCFFRMWGTANWYQGIENPTLWQRVYKWRVGIISAARIAYQIWG